MENISVYEGSRPYIFISYAHANAPAVMQVVEELSARGYRVWYDDGIEVGSEWPEYIASHLAGASLMMAFVSNAYMRSDNCRKEMHYAITKKIPLINIFLEETTLTPGMEMQIGNLFALMKYSMSDSVFDERLFSAPQLSDALLDVEMLPSEPAPARKKERERVPVDLYVEADRQKQKKVHRRIRLGAAAAVLLAVGILFIIGWFTGLVPRVINRKTSVVTIEPVSLDTEIVWTDPLLEQAARAYTGIETDQIKVSDLSNLTELHIRGNQWSFDRGALAEPEQSGSVQDLSDLRYFPNLTFLMLEDQDLDSLQTLPPCGIENLIIRNCRLTSLKGIANLPLLHDLSVMECPLQELGDLDCCLELYHFSLFDSHVTDFSAVKPLIKLAEVEFSGCSLNELKPVFGLSSLTDVALYDCDLRGRFFFAFDREWNLVSLKLADCKLNRTKNLEDFEGLTTLTLVRSGELLDWSGLTNLPVLKTVYADISMAEVLRPVLETSSISLELVEEAKP